MPSEADHQPSGPPPLPPPLPASDRSAKTGRPGSQSAFGQAAPGWLRLHPLTPLIGVAEIATGFAIPLLLVLLFSIGSGLELLLGLSFALSAAFAHLRYFFFRYRLGEDEIVVEEGVLRRTVRHVPYERIQNLDLSRSLVQRAFGVSQLSLQTASGTEPEAVFRWLSRERVEEIESRVRNARAASATRAADASRGDDGERLPDLGAEGVAPGASIGGTSRAGLLHVVPLGDLVLLGLFSARGLALVAAAFGFAWQVDLFERLRIYQRVRDLPHLLGEAAQAGPTLPVLLALAGVALVSLLSIALALIEYHGFHLSDAGTELRTRAGLLTVRSSSIPKGRIQILRIIAPAHLRLFGRVRLRAGTAGGTTDETSGRAWLLPVARRETLARVLPSIQPESVLSEDRWRSVHPDAARRLQRRAVFWIVLLTAVLAIAVHPWASLGLLLVPVGLLLAQQTARHLGYAVSEDAVFARHGWIWQRAEIVRLSKIQAVSVQESPFDRHWGMATLAIDTASPGEGTLHIPYLPHEEALRLELELSREASRRHFRW